MGGVFHRQVTKIWNLRDFENISKNPYRYVRLFPFPTLWKKKIKKSGLRPAVVGGLKVRPNTPPIDTQGINV